MSVTYHSPSFHLSFIIPLVFLLPNIEKIFENITFNRIYSFLLEERLLNLNHSDFPPSNSQVNQLLALTH